VWWRAENPAVQPPTVLAGEAGSFDDLVPSEADVVTAQRRVGSEGFIAYLACNLSSEYHAGTAREITEFAAGYGLPVRVYDSDSDAYRQITELERARADGAKGIIICLLNATQMDLGLTSVQEAGLPLVISNPGDKLYGGIALASDEYALGQAAGRYAGQIIREEMGGHARVIVLDYPSLPSIVRRADGIVAGLLQQAPNATIVGRYPGGTVENGRDSASGLIADGVAFDVIASINDAGAFGAIEALEEAGFAPDSVAVVGIDAEARALEYIHEGYFMRGSVPVARELFSRGAVNGMVMLLAGETVPERVYLDPGEIVTRDSQP
jgi:ABC-type sugar transport system substrate-binding protein